MKFFYALSIFLLAAGTASAQFILRSGHFNPPAMTDNGYEYVEISGPASTQLTNIWLVSIDGDNTASGVIDQAINLSAYSTGSNGLLLLRDASNAYVPTPSPETTVIVSDFVPDLENGGNTFALVVGFSGAVGNDLDTDDDGTLNSTPWTSVEHALAVEDDVADAQYADDMGFPDNNLPEISGPTLDNADAWAIFEGVLYAIDINTTSPAGGPYTVQSAWTNTGALNGSLAGAYVLTPGNTTSPLPIELTTLSALAQARDILLRWKTATERDNAYFAIERATDGNTFREIGQTPSLGNSRAPQTYNFTDPTPAKGTNYYRLRQVDTDGRYSYSPVVTAIMDGSFVRLSPTAATDLLRLTATEPSEETRTWQIFDTRGRLLQSGIWEAESVQHELTISNLPQGHYALRLMDGQAASTVLRFQKM